MNGPSGRAIALVFLLTSVSARASGAPPAGEIFVTVDHSPACVDEQDLIRVVGSQTGRPTSFAHAAGGRAGGADLRLTVSGGPDRIRVRLEGARQVEQVLSASSCATAADVVAAFVASILAPAPAIVLTPLPTAPPPATITITPVGEVGRDPLLAGRATLLAGALTPEGDQSESKVRVGFQLGPALVALGGLTGLALVGTDKRGTAWPSTGVRLAMGGFGLTAAGALASYFAPDDYRATMLGQAAALGAGTAALGLALDPVSQVSAATFGWMSAGFYSLAAFDLVETAFQRPISPLALRADYEAVRTPEQRARLSRADLARIEARLRRTTGVIPPFVKGMVIELVALGVMASGFSESNPARQQNAFIVGGAALGLAVAFQFPALYIGFCPYQRMVRGTGLGPVPLPGGAGFSVAGCF